MTTQIEQSKLKADTAKAQYQVGDITRNEAFGCVQPYISLINKKSVEIAKKYNMKPRKVSIISYLR